MASSLPSYEALLERIKRSRERNRATYQRHREDKLEYQKQYYAAHKERCKTRVAVWRERRKKATEIPAEEKT